MAQSFLVAANNTGIAFPDNTTLWNTLEGIIVVGQTVESWAEISYREAGTFDELKVYASANTTLVTTVVTVRKNSADTALTVSYTSRQTGLKEDSTNSFTVDSSDLLDCQVAVPNDVSGAKTITIHMFSVTFTSDTSTDCISLLATSGQGQNIYGLGTENYNFGGGPENGGDNFAENYFLYDTTAVSSNLYGQIDTNDSTGGTTTLRIMFDAGVTNGNQSVVYTAGQTGGKEDTSNTDSYVTTDTFAVRFTTGADSSTISIGALGVSISNSAVAGISYSINMSSGLISTGCTNTLYNGLSGVPTGAGGAVSGEAKAESKIGFNCSATNYNTYVYYNTSSATSSLQFSVNGVTTSLSVSYTAGQTGAKSDADVVSVIGETDFIDFQTVQGGTGAIYVTNHYLDTYVTKIFIPDIRMLMEL